jgi:hypothetical protein
MFELRVKGQAKAYRTYLLAGAIANSCLLDLLFFSRSRSGEIGIRTRLKIWRGQTHVGSSPTSGTIDFLIVDRVASFAFRGALIILGKQS